MLFDNWESITLGHHIVTKLMISPGPHTCCFVPFLKVGLKQKLTGGPRWLKQLSILTLDLSSGLILRVLSSEFRPYIGLCHEDEAYLK